MSIADEKPEQMATLKCPGCKLSLYMSIRKLQQSWSCPNCMRTTIDIRKLAELDYFELELHKM